MVARVSRFGDRGEPEQTPGIVDDTHTIAGRSLPLVGEAKADLVAGGVANASRADRTPVDVGRMVHRSEPEHPLVVAHEPRRLRHDDDHVDPEPCAMPMPRMPGSAAAQLLTF